jgi:hypothetical protein
MIQFYVPWEGEGGYDENLKKKHRTGLLSKNNNP